MGAFDSILTPVDKPHTQHLYSRELREVEAPFPSFCRWGHDDVADQEGRLRGGGRPVLCRGAGRRRPQHPQNEGAGARTWWGGALEGACRLLFNIGYLLSGGRAGLVGSASPPPLEGEVHHPLRAGSHPKSAIVSRIVFVHPLLPGGTVLFCDLSGGRRGREGFRASSHIFLSEKCYLQI